jgi:hypothetical protein
VEARWAERTERRVGRELGWSGRWTRNSLGEVEVEGGYELDILRSDDLAGG